MRTHTIARKFEDKIASDLGGRRIFLSGAGFDKGDIRVGRRYKGTGDGFAHAAEDLTFRVEAKTTKHDHYTFRRQDWLDVMRAALPCGEHPVFAIGLREARFAFVVIASSLAGLIGFEPGPCPAPFEKSLRISEDALRTGRLRRNLLFSWQLNPTAKVQTQQLHVINYDAFIYAIRAQRTP